MTPYELADQQRIIRGTPTAEVPVAVLARNLITKTGGVVVDAQAIADGDAAALSSAQQFLGIGGGGGLPTWTHATGGSATPADGQFTTNVDTINGTTTFHFANTPKNGEALYGKNLAYIGAAVATITEVGGGSIGFLETSMTLDGEFVVMTGHFIYSYAGSWSGDYSFSFAATVVTVPGFATGWVGNSTVGDPAVVVADYVGGGALAGIDATADAQIVALTKKFAAVEAALANYTFPNA